MSVCARLDKYEMNRLLLSLICLLDDFFFVVTDNMSELIACELYIRESAFELLSKNLAPLNINQYMFYVDPNLSCSIAKN